MVRLRDPVWFGIPLALATLVVTGIARGQGPVPLADTVDEPLLPSGITEGDVVLDAELAYLFNADDGARVVHLVGAASVRVGQDDVRMRADEAIVWISDRAHEDRSYRFVELLLWRNAEIVEVGGTHTSSAALYVTVKTYGTIRTTVEEAAFQSSAGTTVYREGDAIRGRIHEAAPTPDDEHVPLRVVDPSLTRTPFPARPRPQTFGRADHFDSWEAENERVTVATGNAYIIVGRPGAHDAVEIRADAAVLFSPMQADPAPPDSPGQEPGPPAGDPGGSTPRARLPSGVGSDLGEMRFDAVYLEGDVLLRQGVNLIRASRLYYDVATDRAVILDAVIRTTVTRNEMPVYIRASQIRRLSARQYAAEDAILTTSEFHTPHYHVGARRIELTDRTPEDPSGRPVGLQSGSFRIRHATLNVGGLPLAYWPFVQGRVDVGETALRSLRVGYSGDFGAEIETSWSLFHLLGIEAPEGVDAALRLDEFTDRGPAAGIEARYERDAYYGLLRTYHIADGGEDDLGRDREDFSGSGIRGRFLLRHRHFLEDDWQLSFELSHITDRGFLEEFFESEFNDEKEQETLIHLKRQRENWAVTALFQWRLLDWRTQTESLPDLSFRWIGPQPWGADGGLFSESRLGVMRLRGADQTLRELLRDGAIRSSGTTPRADTRNELDYPLDLGPVRVVPFASGRLTAWEDRPDGGSETRLFGTYGLRGSMYLWRVSADAESTLLDIHGIREIIKPDFTVWASHTNVDSHELYPFNTDVEGVDEIDGVSVGLRQRFQTRRGPLDNRRIVDVLTIDNEIGVFNDAHGDAITNGFVSYSRPEASIARSYLSNSTIWRINDRTALLTETNYDLNDRRTEIFNVSCVVERSPRLSYLIGYRLIDETDSHLLALDANYWFTEKHLLAIRELFDLDRGDTHTFTVGLIRKLPRWFTAISFELDRGEDDFGVSFSIWPEGLPQGALGSRRFTGLTSTPAIQQR
jgi:hypothetical protein